MCRRGTLVDVLNRSVVPLPVASVYFCGFRMAQSSLPPEIRGLPVPERVHLVEQICDSVVEDEQAFELTGSQKAELDRRIAAREASPGRGRPWEEVKKRLLNE